jgi:hypothetical protein
MIHDIQGLSQRNEVAAALGELIEQDGAGSWLLLANHTSSNWPAALRPYKDVYLELAPFLPQAFASLDDGLNRARIADFWFRFRSRLRERVNLP